MRLPWKRPRTAPEPVVHVGDPRFDDWDVVRDFEDTETARAWRQHLGQKTERLPAPIFIRTGITVIRDLAVNFLSIICV